MIDPLTLAAAVPVLGICCLAYLTIGPILSPTVISYPWPSDSNEEKDPARTVILAGSYNPPHLGHLAMLEYLAERYGTVVAVVGMNPNKKYKVSPNVRADLLRKALGENKKTQNVRVEVVSGYVWRFAKKEGAAIFYRGIRTWDKDGAEERSLHILNTFGPLVLGPTWPVPTMFLEGKPEYNHISSTLIRNMCQEGGQASLPSLVPGSIADSISKLYQ